MVSHHLDRVRELLRAAATLSDEALAREIRPGLVVVWFEGEEPSAALMCERLVYTLEVWVAAIDGREVPASGAGDWLAALRARGAGRSRGSRKRIRDRGAYDDAFVDALCEPPQSFTYGGVLSHVLAFGAVRRETLAGVLARARRGRLRRRPDRVGDAAMKIVLAGGTGQVGQVLRLRRQRRSRVGRARRGGRVTRPACPTRGGSRTLYGLARPRAGRPRRRRRAVRVVDSRRGLGPAIRLLITDDSFSGPVNLAAPNPLPYAEFMRVLRDGRVGLPATRWMLEVGAFFMRTETELVLKSRRVVPGAARDLVSRRA